MNYILKEALKSSYTNTDTHTISNGIIMTENHKHNNSSTANVVMMEDIRNVIESSDALNMISEYIAKNIIEISEQELTVDEIIRNSYEQDDLLTWAIENNYDVCNWVNYTPDDVIKSKYMDDNNEYPDYFEMTNEMMEDVHNECSDYASEIFYRADEVIKYIVDEWVDNIIEEADILPEEINACLYWNE